MRPLLLACSLLLCTPAHSARLLPYKFAETYCEMRRLGQTHQAGIAAGVHAALLFDSSNEVPKQDIQAAIAVSYELCPNYSR